MMKDGRIVRECTFCHGTQGGISEFNRNVEKSGILQIALLIVFAI